VMVKVEYKEEYRFGTSWNQNPEKQYRYLECKSCGQMVSTSETAKEVICHECIVEFVEPPKKAYKPSGRPRGWHMMEEFVDSDGTVYHKGVEVPELKGTRPVTKIATTPKLSKAQKQKIMNDAAAKVHKLKKELAKAKYKKDKAKISRDIKKFSKIMEGKIPKDFKFT